MPEFGDSFHLSPFFLFQTMFCGTATTIFSGAVAERMKFSSYLIIAVLLSVFIYPVFGHWVWNGIDTGNMTGWLGAAGFINGSLGGLVAVTTCCHCVTIPESVLIGAIAGGVCLVMEEVLLHYGIDDAVGAVPVHLGCGIWGTLAVALFGDPLILDTGLSFLAQLRVQTEGILAAFLVAFVIPLFVIRKIDQMMPMRVSSENEEIGLNISEHGAKTETADFFQVMQLQEETGDLSLRVPADPFADTGVIAARYNKLMASLQSMVATFQQLFDGSAQAVLSTDTHGIITRANKGFETIFGYSAAHITGAHNCDIIVPEESVLVTFRLEWFFKALKSSIPLTFGMLIPDMIRSTFCSMRRSKTCFLSAASMVLVKPAL